MGNASDWDRRALLRALAVGGAAFVLPQAACDVSRPKGRKSKHYFVFYYMMGGWDLTLLTEPSAGVKGVEVDYSPDDIFEHGGHRWGPAMKPLVPYMDRMAVIRGLKAEALNHPQARFQMVTGKFRAPNQQPSASVQSRIAQKIGAGYALPNVSSDAIRPATFLGDLPHHYKPMRIGGMNQLGQLTQVTGSVNKYKDVVAQAIAQRDKAYAARTETELAREFAIYSELARGIGSSDFAKRALEGKRPRFSPTALVKHNNVWGSQAHLAAEVIRQDLAPIVTVGSGEFDSHNRHDFRSHKTKVTRGIETVAAICEGLGSLLDHTTIVVCSEFSRAPRINELGGKHHWPTNSMLLIGKGIKRRADGAPNVFNECDDQVFGQPIDPATGRPDGRGADELLMTHALATIMAIGGIDPVPLLDVDPIIPILG